MSVLPMTIETHILPACLYDGFTIAVYGVSYNSNISSSDSGELFAHLIARLARPELAQRDNESINSPMHLA